VSVNACRSSSKVRSSNSRFSIRARLLTALDAPEILVSGQRQKEASDVGVSVVRRQAAPQVVQLGRRAPQVIDHEVSIAELTMMG
jgi:hypothetical protein